MKLITKKNDGVSPVIGTILLVAITVVLVAIIAAVVMGMTGDVGTSHIVGIKAQDAQNSSGNISITFLSGSTAGLTNLTVFNSTGAESYASPDSSGTYTIGKSYLANVGTGQQKVTIVGVFSDGNQTLLTQSIYVS